MLVSPGFTPKKPASDRLPPGQYQTSDFPVLSLGPTPKISVDSWQLTVSGLVDKPAKFNWPEFIAMPHITITQDIHCVTKWSKFDTTWSGVSFDQLIKLVGLKPTTTHLLAHSYDGYTTNIPIKDLTGNQAIVATSYEDKPIEPSHGGPVRIVLPHLYFWKSAKWLKQLEFVDHNTPGFWEVRGYHNYGDPWKEERYSY